MKGILIAVITALVFAMEASAKNSESQLPLNEVVETGVTKTFGHQQSVVMVDGFWQRPDPT